MPNPLAILVEDLQVDAAETTAALERAGFEVELHSDASSALLALDSRGDVIDLIVLDRRLPMRLGEEAGDEIGDDLLNAVLARVDDVPVVVFSGHSDYSHLQFAGFKRGTIMIRQGLDQFDRVTPLAKGQSLEFDAFVGEVHSCVSRIDDIQITGNFELSGLSLGTKRLLRRVAYEYGGTSVDAVLLTGGLSEAPVFLCQVHSGDFLAARLVAKSQKRAPSAGGFQALLPAHSVAGTVSLIRGLMGGAIVSAQQVAAEHPVSLLELLGTDPDRAAEVLRVLRGVLDGMPHSAQTNVSISEVARCFGDWTQLHDQALRFGIDMPPGTRIATTSHSPQHGDLHPGNVLCADDHPVIIDFDSQVDGSELIDAVLLLFGPLFHKDSPLRGSTWPSTTQCEVVLDLAFLDGCPAPGYFAGAVELLRSRARSQRELYAVILAYCVRQLKYDDVANEPAIRERAVALARWSAHRLHET
jgi:CheY-like chemotaxis protein